ncbi:hypothetical protein EZV62_025618 [Acer yangbiense]|uniref:Phorbol-ester/DAG-type domain-containing protein n=1 Tax=Acer yangbiense TaxID=1000413 RepID=A0A5C7GYC0_9ROSI|nr:hypothetical protein EZV62_025618 [Acer yangbiense]
MEVQIPDQLHQHDLKRKNSKPYVCHGCRELGSGLKFRCEQCNFNLHEECAHVKQTTTHDLYDKNNIFKFFRKPPDHHSIIYCTVCGGLVEGYVYYCEELELCMHPRCHSLPSKFKLYHLEFMLRDRDQVSTGCLRCKERRHDGTDFGIQNGWSYASKCNKYNFHVYCASQFIFSQERKGFLLGNSLEQSIRGFVEVYLGDILKRQRNIVMSFVITNLVLELLSALLDQVPSTTNKTQLALFGMLISFVAMLTCILDFIYEVQTQKPIWRWSSTLPFPWYYYRDEGRKLFGTFKDVVGFICAICQCVVAMNQDTQKPLCGKEIYPSSDIPTEDEMEPFNQDTQKPLCEKEIYPSSDIPTEDEMETYMEPYSSQDFVYFDDETLDDLYSMRESMQQYSTSMNELNSEYVNMAEDVARNLP